MHTQNTRLDDSCILSLTKKGERDLHEPGTLLARHLLEALILIDGQSSVAQVLKRATHVDADVLRASLRDLILQGAVVASDKPSVNHIDPGDFFSINFNNPSVPKLGEQTQAEADNNAKFLQQHGYFVNIVRHRQIKRVQAEGRHPSVLVIEDDRDICKLLQMCLKLENIDSRTAANRDEILAALRSTPLPDMILLDVNLQDINGFDVLDKIRQFPLFKDMPVVMLTASATREAVLRGILSGADGYITKPFEIHPMMRAVKTVLGIKFTENEKAWDHLR